MPETSADYLDAYQTMLQKLATNFATLLIPDECNQSAFVERVMTLYEEYMEKWRRVIKA
jgi:hypothetical protein